jgi:mgtE-like transporter
MVASALRRWVLATRALLGRGGGTRHTLITLFFNSTTSLVAGGFLGSITGTFERHPGLLVLVPAAIGLRGNVFSTLGSRLSTAIHMGTLRLNLRRTGVLGQNVVASLVLTVGMSLLLAVVTVLISVATGLEDTIPVTDMALVSIFGGILASIVVLATTIGLAAGAVRYGWDLDNVIAPTISTLGDVLTLPALWLGAQLLDRNFTDALAWVLVTLSLTVLVAGWRTDLPDLRRIVRQSIPVLLAAGAASALAGVVLEKRLALFVALPALLVLAPSFMSSAGALGGIVASRVSTKLHLGFTSTRAFPDRAARDDMLATLMIGIPVFLFNALGAFVAAAVLGHEGPGIVDFVAVSMLGGFLAVAFAVAIAYWSAVGARWGGVDPDTYGIPVVTSAVDFAGAFSLIFVVVLLGLA